MKLLMISLGCDKNLTNTEEMMGLFDSKGYSFTDDESEAEIIVINTCCFIGDAKEESVNTILQMAELKTEKGGNCRLLIVCGCLAQRYADEIQVEIPEVDAVIGTSAYEDITDIIENLLAENGTPQHKDSIFLKDINYLPNTNTQRLVTTGGHYAYLKIAEGCNKHCTYCIIPSLRGTYRSVPIDKLINEARSLADRGVRELILVAQETTVYGTDLYGQNKLPELLYKLNEIEGLSWIRLLYAYPEEITDELIEAMSACEKVCHYIDMPIQSGSDAVLKRMGRLTDTESIRNAVNKLRERIPDICIRTTFISGFPGETDENHEETVEFVDELEFDRVGVFAYSQEEDTPAAKLPDQIPEEVKEERREEIMLLQQEIVFEKNESLIGTVVEAFIEGQVTDSEEFSDYGQDGDSAAAAFGGEIVDSEDDFDGNVYVARTYRDAPGVDGFIFVRTYRTLMSGDIVKVTVTGANDYDLIGEEE